MENATILIQLNKIKKKKIHYACLNVQESQGLYGWGVMLHWARKAPKILKNSLFCVLGLSRHSLSIWITDYNISLSQCVKHGESVDFQVRRIRFLATTIARRRAVCISFAYSKVLVEQPKIARLWFGLVFFLLFGCPSFYLFYCPILPLSTASEDQVGQQSSWQG